MIKAPQNFVEGNFCIKLTKYPPPQKKQKKKKQKETKQNKKKYGLNFSPSFPLNGWKYKIFQNDKENTRRLRNYLLVRHLGSYFSRSSHRRCSVKKYVLKDFTIFTGKYMCWSLFNKVAGLQVCNFFKKKLQHRCFLWDLQNLKEHLYSRTSANDCFSVGTVNNLSLDWS